MQSWRTNFRRLILFCVMFAVAGTAAARADDASKTVDVNAVLSMTGSAAFLGRGLQESLQVLENLVNKTGGIRGTPLRFVFADDQGVPQIAVQLTNDLLAKKAQVILGSDVAATCSAQIPFVKTASVLYCISPSISPDRGSYIYSASISTDSLIATTMRYFRLRGMKHIAVLTSTDATGQDAEKSVDMALALPENRDVVRVANEHFGMTDLSLRPQIANIRKANPDVLFVWTTGTAFGTVLRDLRDSAYDVPVVASPSNQTYKQLEQLAQYGIKVYFPSKPYVAPEKLPPGKVRDTIEAMYAALATINVKPDVGTTLAWDPGLLIVAALRAIGPNATATQIKGFIDAQRAFPGVNGSYNFAEVPQRGLSDKNVIMVVWDPAKGTFSTVSKFGGSP